MGKEKTIVSFLKSVSTVWSGTIFGAFLAFVLQVFLAREFSPEGYGLFSAAFASITLITPLAAFGVHQFLLRIFGKEGWEAFRWVLKSFNFVLLGCFIVSFIILLWAFFGPHDQLFSLLLIIMIPLVFGHSVFLLVSTKLQLEERFSMLALWTPFPHFLRFFLVFIFFLVSNWVLELSTVAIAFSLSSVILLFVGLLQLRSMRFGKIDLKGHDGPKVDQGQKNLDEHINLMKIFQNTWPYGVNTILYLIFFQSDVILLEYISGSKSAGIYNVAFTILMGVYLLPSVIYQQILMPKIHRWVNRDSIKFFNLQKAGYKYMLFLGLLVGGSLFFIAPILIPFIFGNIYAESSNILLILSFAVPIKFLSTSIGAPFYTERGMKSNVRFMGYAALLNIGLNIILIPYFFEYGAAFATLISEVFLLFLYFTYLDKVFSKKRATD
jgi:O-antigen/teichoic acid export membrane protein